MAGASGCNASMDRDEAAVAATGLLAKLIMPEDKVMMKEIWKEIPHTFKYLRLANDSFEYEPEKRAGAAAVFRNTKRVRTMKVDVKRRRDERFATWQRRIEVRREQKAVFERENIAPESVGLGLRCPPCTIPRTPVLSDSFDQ